jgi:hypothetical protein
MHSCWPVALAAGAATDAFALARFIGSWCCCRCLHAGSLHMNCSSFQWVHIGPLHWQLVLLPMPSSWPIQYAIAAAASGFVLAHYICSFSNCRCLRAGPLHMHCSSCRCLRVGPLHMHCSSCQFIRVGLQHRELLLLPMPFALAHCKCKCSSCRCFRAGPLNMRCSSCRFL